MSISVSTCVPSSLLKGADSIFGYMCCYLIEIVKSLLSGRTEIPRENMTISVGVWKIFELNSSSLQVYSVTNKPNWPASN
jgi:hypothetical protein